MANNHSNQISPLVNNDYNPNNLSIFPELLQPVNPNLAAQALQPPAVLPEQFGGENGRRHPPRIVTIVAQGLYYELLVLEQGTGATPSQTLNNNTAGWTLPGPPSNIHPAQRTRVSRPTPNINPPAERTVSRPIRDLYPVNVPTRRRSAASSRTQIRNSDGHPGFPYRISRQESPVPEPRARANNINCSICLNPFLDPTATKCGHVFCRSCINRAYRVQRRCPMCRTWINTRSDLLRIYLS